jgi:acyl-CoA dehydrogenase
VNGGANGNGARTFDKGVPEAATTRPLPPFTPEHAALRERIGQFVASELRPHADEWEAERWFPNTVFEQLAAEGLLGLKYPTEYGGAGGDYLDDAILIEELSRCGSGGVAAGVGAHVNIGTPPIFKFGTEEQKQRFLVPGIGGEKIVALGITEPGTGSDVASVRTKADRVDGGWVVNGAKTFITGGVRADVVVTAVKTSAEGGHGGLSFLLVEKEMEGFTVSKKLEKLGWHASDTAELAFQDVFVPEENLLGEVDKGFYLIMANFQWERIAMALGAVAAMQRLLEQTVSYALERQQFGRQIGKFQAIRHKIAGMAVKFETSRALTYNALRMFHEGQDAIREVSMAKLMSQRAACEVADDALQIHGGAGYVDTIPGVSSSIQRAVRDLRLGPIGGGTDEIMKEIIGRQMGL